MSFFKLSKEERSEWRSLPATKAAIAFIRNEEANKITMALAEMLKGEGVAAAGYAGMQQALKIIANQLESD